MNNDKNISISAESYSLLPQSRVQAQYACIQHLYVVLPLLPCAEEIHNLRDFHHFSFVRNNNDKCIIDHKPWCSASSWEKQKWKTLGPMLIKSGSRRNSRLY